MSYRIRWGGVTVQGESLLPTLSYLFKLFPKATRGLEPISYRGVLVSTLLHANEYVFLHNLLNVLVQVANKMGFQKKYVYAKTVQPAEGGPDMANQFV
jgi:ribosomal protein L32E